jgi:serine/threonine-protein kinase
VRAFAGKVSHPVYWDRVTSTSPLPEHRVIGRYAIHGEIASGGMATVHLGRLLGEAGFSRTVAIKRLHENLAKDPEFVSMFLDEARLASRVRHPNVVSILDVVVLGKEVFLVMDYVQGASVSRLARSARSGEKRIPPKISLSIAVGALQGLHAAHEAKSETGQLLGIVHRDVSPQNILVDVDGVARVIDFGVAKAAGRLQSTREGTLKGKLQYMPPEQIKGDEIDRRADIYSLSVVLWELLANRRMFKGQHDVSLMHEILDRVVNGKIEAPSLLTPGLPKALDGIVLRGLAARAEDRWQTARDMAIAIERALVVSSTREVGDWVRDEVGDELREKAERIAEIESISSLVTSVQTPAGGDPISQVTSPSLVSLVSSPSGVSAATIVSLPSAVSLAAVAPSPVATAPPSSGRNVVILSAGVAIGIVGLGIIGAFVLLRTPPRPAEPSDPNTVASTTIAATSATAVVEEPPTVSIEELAKVAEEAGASEPDAGKRVTATKPPAVIPTVPVKPPADGTKPPTDGTKPPPAKPPSAANCDPPFTVDAEGIKRYKPECLR